MTFMDRDANGFPVILADPVDPPAKVPLIPTTRPTSVNHVEWARRMDAVREAAREFEQLTDQDIKERLAGKTGRPLGEAEITAFRADVHAAQLDDLVDILDQQVRGKLRGRRTVRLNAPRGYIKKTVGALDDADTADLIDRLRARGWDDKQVAAKFPDAPDPPPTRSTARSQPAKPPTLAPAPTPVKLEEPVVEETEFTLNRNDAGVVETITKRTTR